MYENISSIMPDSVLCTMIHGQIVGLIKSDFVNKPSIIEQLRMVSEQMGYVFGVSNDFCDLKQITAYYQQACYVVDDSPFSDAQYSSHLFSDCALSYMLSNCTAEMPPEAVIPCGLTRLAELDRVKESEYIKALNIYLRNEMNASKTAEALFIHRSSLMKRLEKIERILGRNLDNPDYRLLLRMSLIILEEQK